MPKYTDIIAAIHARLETITPAGLRAHLTYEPTALQTYPLAYTIFGRFDRLQTAHVPIWDYDITLRVAVPWQDNEGAEVQLAQFLPGEPYSITALLDDRTDPDGLTRLVDNDTVTIVPACVGVFVGIGGTQCKANDFTVHVRHKNPEV